MFACTPATREAGLWETEESANYRGGRAHPKIIGKNSDREPIHTRKSRRDWKGWLAWEVGQDAVVQDTPRN